MACLWWFVLRKMLRISKAYRITSIADFIASRYGKSVLLGGLVTVIAVFGIMPYISLQLKAVSTSVTVLLGYPGCRCRGVGRGCRSGATSPCTSPCCWRRSAILFGTRHIDATEHHQGMVAAIAFESVVKLVAFVAVGLFVTFGMYGGLADIFARAAESRLRPSARPSRAPASTFTDWFAMTCLSGLAILFLPRQFQVAVIENINEDHLTRRSGCFRSTCW